jgi:predicted peptidase
MAGVVRAQNEKPGGTPNTPVPPPPPATAPAGGGGGGGFWNFVFGAPSAAAPQGLAVPADGIPRASGFYKLKFQAQVQTERGPRRVQMAYVLYLPKGYEAGKDPCPTVVFLHGAGEAGTDADGIFVHGPAMEVQRQAGSKFADSFPFIIVGPQCPPRGERWDQQAMLRAVLALLDDLGKRVRIDPDRVYVTGLSMGGKGTWLLAMEAPQRFAAIAPIAADTLDTQGAQRLKYTSVWAIDGALDFGGGPENNQKMVEAIQKAGGDAKVSIVPGEGHFVWARFYGEPSFYDWFLQHKRLTEAERKQRDAGAAGG